MATDLSAWVIYREPWSPEDDTEPEVDEFGVTIPDPYSDEWAVWAAEHDAKYETAARTAHLAGRHDQKSHGHRGHGATGAGAEFWAGVEADEARITIGTWEDGSPKKDLYGHGENDTSPPNAPGFTKNDEKLWARGAPSSQYVGDAGAPGAERPQAYITSATADKMGLDIPGALPWKNGRPRYAEGRAVSGQRISNAADHLLKSIRNGDPSQPVLWRGMRPERGEASAAHTKWKVGEEVKFPAMSFSRSPLTAALYSGARHTAEHGPATILRLAVGSRGYAVRNHYPWDNEVITAGTFAVRDVSTDDLGNTFVDVEQVAAP